jgi:HSP20 family protein
MATGLTRRHGRRMEKKREAKGGLIDRLFGDVGEGRGLFRGEPALDVIDRDDEVVVRADLPGMSDKDVEVEIAGDKLTLRGERHEEREEKEEDYYFSERWEGSFLRTIELPEGVDPDKASARFDAGVLEVHVPKVEAKPVGRRIEIKGPHRFGDEPKRTPH